MSTNTRKRWERRLLYQWYCTKYNTTITWSKWDKWFYNLVDPDYFWKEFDKAQEEKKMNLTPISLGSLNGCDCPICRPEPKAKKTENTMRATTYGYEAQAATAISISQQAPVKSEAETQREYLMSRLTSISYDKKGDDLRRAFGLIDDEAPKNKKERDARIAAGKYVINWNRDDEDMDEDREYYDIGYGSIRWRDPALKEDIKGFEAAREKIDEDKVKYTDIIKIMPATDGLKAVQEFETKTYH